MKIPNKAIIIFEYNDENREYIFDIKELSDIIKEKQLIIDKAIEYIKQYGNLYCLKDKQFKDYQQYKDLLDILKGSDTNEYK